jgi:nitrate reductase gamma subunit
LEEASVTVVLYAIAWGAIAVFLAASVARAVKYARQPIHLRWELYPVPHERADRLKHGGSYFEASEWWTSSREFNWAGEIRAMVPEMVLLDGLRRANRRLWYRSFPFHFGLYLMSGSAALLATSAGIWLATGERGALVESLRILAGVIGVLGLASSFAGACALLHRRLTDVSLREYTTPADVFNLLFFIVTLGVLAVGYGLRPAGTPGALATTRGLLATDSTLRIAGPFAVGLMLLAALVAYVPLTHMSHFIAKYFTYHAVRWDDAPLKDRERMAAKIANYLTYRPTWSAPHVAGPARPTSAEVASSTPREGQR